MEGMEVFMSLTPIQLFGIACGVLIVVGLVKKLFKLAISGAVLCVLLLAAQAMLGG